MTLSELAKALHGSLNGKWINVAGPGHSSDDRSLGIKFDADTLGGFCVNSLAGDEPDACQRHVMALLQAIAEGGLLELENTQHSDESESARIARALAIWDGTVAVLGTPAATYLTMRGCDFALAAIGGTLRFHPQCPFGQHCFPALVALMRNSVTGEPQGIHRTALKDDGAGKRVMPDGMNPKMMMGVASGAAVCLQPGATRMGIAEGIETALSAQKIFGMPVWAVMSAGGIAQFPIIPGIKELMIFADHDDVGLTAAQRCATRYANATIDGKIHYPAVNGTDWNDYVKGEGYHVE